MKKALTALIVTGICLLPVAGASISSGKVLDAKAQVVTAKHHWNNYPHCNTLECVQHTKQIRKDRLERCKKNSRTVKASVFGGSSGDDNGTGYKGDRVDKNGNHNPPAYAELNGGTALGGLPYRYRLTIFHGKRHVTAYKLDTGGGGGNGASLDIHKEAANTLHISTTRFLGKVKITHNRCA